MIFAASAYPSAADRAADDVHAYLADLGASGLLDVVGASGMPD